MLPLTFHVCNFSLLAALERYPSETFTPLSTEVTRSTRQRLTKNRTIQRYHRAKSVYLRNEQEVKTQFGLLPKVINLISSLDSFQPH